MAIVKRPNVQQAQVEQELDQALKSADPMRLESLQRLQRVRAARTKSQERERLRLSEKLGAEHPRVLALQAKIDTAYEVERSLKLEAVRAQTTPPSVDADACLVHGRVLNAERTGVPGMKTALYDRSACPIETCGGEITDKTGYFSLTVKKVAGGARETAEIKKNVRDVAGIASTGSQGVDAAGNETAAGKTAEAFVYVLDRNDVILYRDKRPLALAAGQAQYLEIVLDDEDLVPPSQPKTRYLGNSGTRELHDLNNRKPACQIDEIRSDHRVYFKNQKEALALKYDFCAYCFGKDKSKR